VPLDPERPRRSSRCVHPAPGEGRDVYVGRPTIPVMSADSSSTLGLLVFLRFIILWLAYFLAEGANATAKLPVQVADPADAEDQ
jgi:hypothetical protein